MKRIISLLLTSALILSVFCVTAVTSAAAAGTEFSVAENSDKIRPVGRSFLGDDGLICDWTASGIEFSAECEGDVSLKIHADCKTAGGLSNTDCYYTVYVDGVRKDERLRVISGNNTVAIATDLASGLHTFKIVKQTEAVVAATEIQSIIVNGTLGDRPSDPEYVFDVIGDSISSGYGALGVNNQAAVHSDGTRTYAYVAAENFGAEVRVTSVSGTVITSAYNQYKQLDYLRSGLGDYNFSDFKKPNAVIMALGTNDKERTVEYWQTNLQKFMDLIRGGYNDYTIPFVFVWCIMDNSEQLRINVNTAFENLQKIDAEKYSYTYMTNGNRSGGHPNQSGHLFAAKKLTQCLVNNGIMPASALKSDATVTLTPTQQDSMVINNFDSLNGLTVPDGIKYESVEPLYPTDKDNDTAHAAKFTADGSQTSGKIKLNTSSINAGGFRIKGISMYLKYTDTADYTDTESPVKTLPKLFLQSSDKSFTQTLNAADGEVTKAGFTWENSDKTNFVFIHVLMESKMPNISIELGTDSCEYIVDNISVILNDYAVYDNPNAAYKALSSFPVIGVIDTDVTEPETTTGRDSAPHTFKTLFDADSAENAVTYSGSGLKAGSLGITDAAGLPYNTQTGSSKLLKYMTNGMYENPQVTFSGDVINQLAQDSVGVRIWVAADKESPAGGRSGVMFRFYDSVSGQTYSASSWGYTYSAIGTGGNWYSLYWDDYSTSSKKLAIGAGGGTVSANSIYKNITKITVSSGVNGNGNYGTLVDNNIYIDDLQFIYPDNGEAPSVSESTIAPSEPSSEPSEPTKPASGEEVLMQLTADQINFVQCKNSVSATKTAGAADDDYVVKFDLASKISSDKGFAISIPKSIFTDYSPTKIVYKLRADETYDSGYGYMFFSISDAANNQNAAPAESDTLVRYGQYENSTINTTTTVKTISASNSAHENIFKNGLNVAYFYNKLGPATKTIYVEAIEVYYIAQDTPSEPSSAEPSQPSSAEPSQPSSAEPSEPSSAEPSEPSSNVPMIKYGDANGNGDINLLDLLFMRKHLAKWNIEIDTKAADCNVDGDVNLLDLLLMRKYLAKWNVVLGPQK